MSRVDDSTNKNFPVALFPRYIVAYKEAGDRLVHDILRDRSFQHELALPIAFLYQHYLELGLKHLISIGNKLSSKPAEWKLGFPTVHNLHGLLNICKETLRRVEKEQSGLLLSELRLDVIEACISTFYSKDIFAFRYPISTEGTLLLEDTDFIDVWSLSEAIDRVESFYFDEAIMTFSDFSDQKP
jgi:hypothetical protein